MAAAVAVLMLASVMTGTANADAGPQCGDTLTHNVKLTRDLQCAGGGTALTIGVQGVFLNLNGHSITGDGTGFGITVAANGQISNGVVANFSDGVNVDTPGNSSSFTVIDHVTLRGNGTGFSSTRLTVLKLRDDILEFNDYASSSGGTQLEVVRATVRDNNFGLVAESTRTSVRDSLFERNGLAGWCSQGLLSLSNTTVRYNRNGLRLDQCDGSQLLDDTFDNDGVAVSFEAFFLGFGPTRVLRSTFTRNVTGISMDFVMSLGVGGTIASNRFANNGTGIHDGGGDCDAACAGTRPRYEVTGNVFASNTADGLRLDQYSAAARIGRNTATGNGGWGIYVDLTSGSVDAGGNRASRNGQPAQCSGVVCAP